MNEMYKYLKEHSYISQNKKSNYQFELSKERAECIANKYENLINDLQQENQQLKDNWNKLKEYISIKLYNTEYLQKLCGCGIDDFDHILLDAIREEMKKLEEGEK